MACISYQGERSGEIALVKVVVFKFPGKSLFNDPVTVIERKAFANIDDTQSVIVA